MEAAPTDSSNARERTETMKEQAGELFVQPHRELAGHAIDLRD
jgi:hypothetical protein